MVKDAALFSKAMADVKPLGGRRRQTPVDPAPESAKPVEGNPVRSRIAAPPVKAMRAAPCEPELRTDDRSFDRDVARALSRGKLAPEATLDLHGMTLVAAERAVDQFLERVTGRDFRVVLIVTGKGLREESGRLMGGRIRTEFIGWLNRTDNRARVRSVRAAHQHHGGSGAFYVLLRRRKRS